MSNTSVLSFVHCLHLFLTRTANINDRYSEKMSMMLLQNIANRNIPIHCNLADILNGNGNINDAMK
jgi:hypothetical protein